MFSETADFYDLLYSFKDYELETEKLVALLEPVARRPLETLLDVACGTGGHLLPLSTRFRAEGLDLDDGMLAVARTRLPQTPLHRADFCGFDLGKRFDVVTCLFSSIAYAGTVDRLRSAATCLAAHVAPGGVLAVEPWIAAERFEPDTLHVHASKEGSRAVTRLTRSSLEGRLSVLEMHYLLADGSGIRHVSERHEPALFAEDEYREAFEAAGLEDLRFDPEGIFDRGLWLARSPEGP